MASFNDQTGKVNLTEIISKANIKMFRTYAVISLLLAPTVGLAASHEEILRLNAVQNPGTQVICHVPLNIAADQNSVTVDYKNSMTVIANQGDTRLYQVITTFIPNGTTTSVLTQRYKLSVITDETGQTHKIDPDSVSVTSPSSAELARINEDQLRNGPASYQSDSMVTVTDFPNFTIQGYDYGPVTECTVLPVKG
ncbi:hypothetical protein [Leclercia sp.]|uniref:hypothetical protein n=1 Tax=Leclercia sp. TaxID=1898428 RepID=UPI00289E4C67|nr:hypothetical protein [Leclercia sp.]